MGESVTHPGIAQKPPEIEIPQVLPADDTNYSWVIAV
jgi:hypothetical protein